MTSVQYSATARA